MKPLSQMTRDELWSLTGEELLWLAMHNKVTPRIESDGMSFDTYAMASDLDEIRLELQQAAAEHKHDRRQDR